MGTLINGWRRLGEGSACLIRTLRAKVGDIVREKGPSASARGLFVTFESRADASRAS